MIQRVSEFNEHARAIRYIVLVIIPLSKNAPDQAYFSCLNFKIIDPNDPFDNTINV